MLHNCCFLFSGMFQKKSVTADFVQSPILLELDVPWGLGLLGDHCARQLLVKEHVSIPASGLQKTPDEREDRGPYKRHVEQEQLLPCKNHDCLNEISGWQVTRRWLIMQQVIKLWLATGSGKYQKFLRASRHEYGRRSRCGSFDTKKLWLRKVSNHRSLQSGEYFGEVSLEVFLLEPGHRPGWCFAWHGCSSVLTLGQSSFK